MKYKIFHGKPASFSDRRFYGVYRTYELRHSEVRVKLLALTVSTPKQAMQDLGLFNSASFKVEDSLIRKSEWEIIERPISLTFSHN